MTLEPLRIIPALRLCGLPDAVGAEYPICDQAKHGCAIVAKAFKQIVEANKNIGYVAMCTTPMLQAYKALPDLVGTPTLNHAVSIFDFTNLDTTEAHSLRKRDHTKVAEALVSYTAFLDSVPVTDSPHVLCVTSTIYNISSHRYTTGKVMRQKLIQNLLSALSHESNPDHQIYFDWLREYGEEL